MPGKTRPTRIAEGRGVDSHGGPVIDPTENVIALTEAANKRQDDLRIETRVLFDAKAKHLKEIVNLHATFQRRLDRKESSRLDAIRQVDREEVIKAAVAAQQAITTLAQSTTTVAETLRNQLAATALAAENRQAGFASETSKRISALELSFSEGRGKQTVIDPQLEKLTTLVESLAKNQAEHQGKESGFSASWAILLGGAGFLLTILTISGVIYAGTHTITQQQATPQVIYTPSPPGTMLPTTPPQSTPR